jgi:phosphatidylinositol 4-phosphatase
VIGRNVILSVLFENEIIGKPNGTAFENLPGKFEEHFRRIWTINADALSILYTGTTALKTDFTRYY